MGNLGSGELLVIFLLALIVLGPTRLPDAARQVGRAVTELRRLSGGFQREMREAMQEPVRAVDDLRDAVTDPFGARPGTDHDSTAISVDGEAPPTTPSPPATTDDADHS